MSTKLHIRSGAVEVDFDGDINFTIGQIKELLSHVVTLSSSGQNPEDGVGADAPAGSKGGAQTKQHTATQKLHITSVANKLGVKTGPELAVAAAAVLQIYEGKESFARSDLSNTMKKATMHYKASMIGNLTQTIHSLVGKKFNQISDDVYSLTASEYENLVAQLA